MALKLRLLSTAKTTLTPGELELLNWNFHEIETALSNLGANNPSNPDVDPVEVNLTQYFYLPGRAGGQVAHGGTEATDKLYLNGSNATGLSEVWICDAIAIKQGGAGAPIDQSCPVFILNPNQPTATAGNFTFQHVNQGVNPVKFHIGVFDQYTMLSTSNLSTAYIYLGAGGSNSTYGRVRIMTSDPNPALVLAKASDADTGDYLRCIGQSLNVITRINSNGRLGVSTAPRTSPNTYQITTFSNQVGATIFDGIALNAFESSGPGGKPLTIYEGTTNTTRLEITNLGAIRAGSATNILQLHAQDVNISTAVGGTNIYNFGVGTATGTLTGNGVTIRLLSTASGNSPKLIIDNRTNGSNAGILQQIIRKAGQTGNLLEFLDSDGTTILSRVDKDGVWVGPGATTFPDNTFRLYDSVDPSKLLAFELGGLTTLTTRTLTPQNASYIIAGTNIYNVFTTSQDITPDSDVTGLRLIPLAGSTANIFEVYETGGNLVTRFGPSGFFECSSPIFHNGYIDSGADVVLDLSQVTTSRTQFFPDVAGTFILRTGSIGTNRVPFWNGSTITASLITDSTFTFNGSTDTLAVANISNGATGFKLGTATSDKIGFWNATPVVQPTTSITGSTHTAVGGAAVNADDTWDGYTIGKVVAALRQTGILA